MSPAEALNEIGSDFLSGTPTWYYDLTGELQKYLVAGYQWTVATEPSKSQDTVESVTPEGGGTASANPSTTTAPTGNPVVPGLLSGISGPPLVRLIGTDVYIASSPTSIDKVPVTASVGTSSIQTHGVNSVASISASNSLSLVATAAGNVNESGRDDQPDQDNYKSRSKESVLGIAIGISLGGAFLAAVFLLLVIAVIKQRRQVHGRNIRSDRTSSQSGNHG